MEDGRLSVVEPGPVKYNDGEFITTKFGNKISKKSVLCGADKICVQKKTIIESGAIIRGDLAVINIGFNVIVGQNVVIRPPEIVRKDGLGYITVNIGDHCVLESDSIIEAAKIGSYVHIGRGCVIGERCMIQDCSMIQDNTVLAPGTTVPPFCIYGGSPGVFIRKLPESFQEQCKLNTKHFYDVFDAEKKTDK